MSAEPIEFAPELPTIAPAPRVVTLQEFAGEEEEGTEPLIGDSDNVLLGESTDAMVYGDGGAGKTTLTVDLGFHLAAGDDWLGLKIARPLRVLFIENEGPRPLFRRKLRRKLDAWAGSPIDDRLLVWESPWATFTFAEAEHRLALADVIRDSEVDVVIVGPVVASGMHEAGTLQDVRGFADLLDRVRSESGRRVAFLLVHHENKGGKVSGAWEGCGDTLLHVNAQGHGRTRVFVQKARWASAQHGTTWHLTWADGEAFTLEDVPEVDDDTVADRILDIVSAEPGIAWSKVAKQTKGVGNDRRSAVRDGLFAAGKLLNVVKKDGAEVALRECQERRASRLFAADDPTIGHLLPDSGAGEEQTAPAWGAAGRSAPAPCSPPYRGAGGAGADPHPDKTLLGDEDGIE